MNALQSLYGASALAGNVGGLDRKQETHTPEAILGPVRAALGGAIQLDPCAASEQACWFAGVNITLPPAAVALEAHLAGADKKTKATIMSTLKPFYRALPPVDVCPGFTTFVNPPFGFLELWMRWCARRGGPTIGLWPVRTHRRWWVSACKGAEVVLLDYKVVFVGHKNAFPAPLCLVSWGCTVPDLGPRETGRWRP